MKLRLVVLLACLPALTLAAPSAPAQQAFDATFSGASGNEWWIQVQVSANEPLAAVEASVDGGAWKPLVLRDWGAWAASHHAPEGSVVRFRATAQGGATDLSGCHLWTSAAATTCPDAGTQPPAGVVAFRHAGGNEWWVEAVVEPRPSAVEAMDTGGAWTPLTFRSWGEWAGSFRVEPGHEVRFRALHGGNWTTSCWFSHPDGAARACGTGPVRDPPPPVEAGSRRLVVLGDTGAQANARLNVQGSLDDGATGLVGTGDYYYWDPPSQWVGVFRPLLEKEARLAIGNHDDVSALAAWFPNGTTWSASVAGARVVGVDAMRPMGNGTEQHRFVREALCGAPEPMRVVVTHHTWWLGPGARHPGSEFPATAAEMDALVRDCGVDLVLAGHEHNYQRLVRGGVAFVIVGTGGASLYPVQGAPNGTVASHSGYGRLLLDLNATGYAAHFRTLDNRTIDSFRGSADATLPPVVEPAVRFEHRGGNEWWVEARVSPAPERVEAMDTGGAWTALTIRSWGNWAGSFRIEPGHEVRFRALHAGTWTESCWFAHPSGGAARCDSSPPAFDAAFSRPSGNEWWIQVHVDANRALSRVDARVNGGEWKPLVLRDWGDWAASHHAPRGSRVEFRATAADGATDASGPYAWPPA